MYGGLTAWLRTIMPGLRPIAEAQLAEEKGVPVGCLLDGLVE
jgi:hypothetical protein